MGRATSEQVMRTPSYRNRSSVRKTLRDTNYDEWRFTHLISQARKRAKSTDVPFSLTVGDLRRLYNDQGGVCAVSRLAFERTKFPGTPCPRSMSIDRIKATDGYTASNIRLVLTCVNSLRYNGTDEEMFEVVEAIYQSLTTGVL